MITLWGELYMLGELRQIWGSCYNMDASSNFKSFNKEQKDFINQDKLAMQFRRCDYVSTSKFEKKKKKEKKRKCLCLMC